MRCRHLLTAVFFALALLFGASKASASVGIGLQAGYTAPTKNARDLLEQEVQLGIRFLLPPYTPFGLIPLPLLMLDLGIDMPARAFGNLGGETAGSQMVNIGALYRFNLPIARQTLLFFGAGARVSTLIGFIPEAISDLLYFGRVTGGINVAGGASVLLGRQILLDIRIGYGIFGFEYFEATGGLLLFF